MICWEIDWRSPYDAFSPLAGEPHAHLLHGGDQSAAAQWSIIVAFPKNIIAANAGGDETNIFQQVEDCLGDRSLPNGPHRDLPFMSGLVGYVGYEAARSIEPSLEIPASPFELPDMSFGAFDAAVLFSRKRQCAFIVGREEQACRRLRDAIGRQYSSSDAPPAFAPAVSNFTQQQFEAGIGAAIDDILDGQYYQANIAHQISTVARADINAFELFRRLARRSDAYFGGLLNMPEGAIISNSPERFFRISCSESGARHILAEPIKGTRPRGASPEQDAALARELTQDPKDRAENIMIADLMRNDLSKICRDGTIGEDAICELISLSNVHHLVSRISGELRTDAATMDVFRALFPCGSVTGAPKVEAMKAIARTEETGRGPYCGAIGYMDDRGGADFAVAIRTMIVASDKRRLTIPVGGGITLRSNPHAEYMETMTKASAALEAIGNPIATGS